MFEDGKGEVSLLETSSCRFVMKISAGFSL